MQYQRQSLATRVQRSSGLQAGARCVCIALAVHARAGSRGVAQINVNANVRIELSGQSGNQVTNPKRPAHPTGEGCLSVHQRASSGARLVNGDVHDQCRRGCAAGGVLNQCDAVSECHAASVPGQVKRRLDHWIG